MPLFHVGGTSYALMAISAGAHIYMMRTPDPAAALAMLEAERITHTFYVPALHGGDEPGARRRRARLLVAPDAVLRRFADAAAGHARFAEDLPGRPCNRSTA